MLSQTFLNLQNQAFCSYVCIWIQVRNLGGLWMQPGTTENKKFCVCCDGTFPRFSHLSGCKDTRGNWVRNWSMFGTQRMQSFTMDVVNQVKSICVSCYSCSWVNVQYFPIWKLWRRIRASLWVALFQCVAENFDWRPHLVWFTQHNQVWSPMGISLL
jgi:hypothetical protein